MHHGAVEVVAYQETLMIMAAFGVAILAIVWAGFRRWLRHKERIDLLLVEHGAQRSAKSDAQMNRVEARLDAIERKVSGDPAQTQSSSLS